jgi:branched-chain amino acid transport system substrate-binding protein
MAFCTQPPVLRFSPLVSAKSAWAVVGLAELAYFKMINDQGSVNGRKIKLISVDDAFSPPKTVEQTRKLVEEHGVAIIFNSAGVGSLAVRKYLNDHPVPQLFVFAPPDTLDDP